LFISSANSLLTTPFTATTPPKADIGSHFRASLYDSNRVSLIANPQGFPCFTIHIASLSPKLEAIFIAPFISVRLLKLASPLIALKLLLKWLFKLGIRPHLGVGSPHILYQNTFFPRVFKT